MGVAFDSGSRVNNFLDSTAMIRSSAPEFVGRLIGSHCPNPNRFILQQMSLCLETGSSIINRHSHTRSPFEWKPSNIPLISLTRVYRREDYFVFAGSVLQVQPE